MLAKLDEPPKGELCLIFAGKILKDSDSLESQGNNVYKNLVVVMQPLADTFLFPRYHKE